MKKIYIKKYNFLGFQYRRMIEKNQNNKLLIKSSFWYTICSFLFKAVTFLVTPFFARILSKSDMGIFSNFSSWILIMSIFTALDLQESIILLKVDNEKDLDCYIFSILSLTSIVTLLFFIICFSLRKIFLPLLNINMEYFCIIFLYLLFTPAYQMYITKLRAYYKYKVFVLITGIQIVSSSLLSVFLVFFMQNKLSARIMGNYLPYILIGLVLYIFIVFKGKKININYWKSALNICLPLVPHVLSLYLLGSSDKIIITKISGSSYTALYAMAYTIYTIVSVFSDSFNKSLGPWIIENLHNHKINEIQDISKKCILIFCVIIFFVLLLSPEIIFFLGGSQYLDSIYCVPPLVTSCMFQFIYSFFIKVELFSKKTKYSALATSITAIINIILNLIIIQFSPENGHIIASYTTLVSYGVLFLLHYLVIRKLNMNNVFSLKTILLSLFLVMILAFLVNFIYSMNIIRYIIIFIFIVFVCIFFYKNRKLIINLLKK